MKIIFNIAHLTDLVGLSYTVFIPTYRFAGVGVEVSQTAPQPQQAKIKDEFLDLVIQGKCAISDAASCCKISYLS